jgi:signal transduction histidine kinase
VYKSIDKCYCAYFKEKLRINGFSIGVLIFSATCYLLSFFMVRFSENPQTTFVEEFSILVSFSFFLELIGSRVSSLGLFRANQTLRFLILLIIFRIFNEQSVVISCLLTMPFLFESVMYDRTQFATVFNAICLVIFTVSFSQQLQNLPIIDVFFFLSVYLLLTTVTSIFALFFVLNREDLVKWQDEIDRLNSTVVTLSNANKAFQTYAENVHYKSAEDERNRITREMHDTVGYALTNVIIMMDAGKILLKENPVALEGIFDRLKAQTDKALGETRQILYRLRDVPQPMLKGLQAIQHLVKSFQEVTNIEITFNMGNVPSSFGALIDVALLRLVQEGLTNAFRHGKADKITINFWLATDELRVSVWDNGQGFPFGKDLEIGIGLKGMQERFAFFGGLVVVENAMNGFLLQATIPFKNEEIHE